jgi:BirA family biotin operon repressor/biotin-[acetyl-CoA-carboxylase] ligase
VRDFIANLTKTEVKIKWPNDLILKNKKICGMLFEKKEII